jgi:hypothetical protein
MPARVNLLALRRSPREIALGSAISFFTDAALSMTTSTAGCQEEEEEEEEEAAGCFTRTAYKWVARLNAMPAC